MEYLPAYGRETPPRLGEGPYLCQVIVIKMRKVAANEPYCVLVLNSLMHHHHSQERGRERRRNRLFRELCACENALNFVSRLNRATTPQCTVNGCARLLTSSADFS